MFLPNVDSRTRTYLLDEFQRDVNAGRLHVPHDLSPKGAADWPVLLQLTLMESGPAALAQHLGHHGRMQDPHRAIAVAEAEYLRLYGRAICRRALDDGQSEVEVVSTASVSAAPKRSVGARRMLYALRAWPETPLGLPDVPGSGEMVAVPTLDQRRVLAA